MSVSPEEIIKNKRVLCIEDNVYNQAIQRVILERYGAKVIFERWGKMKSILRKLETAMPVDLILMDLMLANDLSGYELYHELQAYPEYQSIPVVIVSASEPSIEMPRAREIGLAGFISKPISMALFPGQIAQVLSGQKIWYGA